MSCANSRLRSDAERRRLSILNAAEELFARGGSSVSLEDIAREAGVGIATLYRRFPSREALIEAVFAQPLTEFADAAEHAADRARTEPGPAFRGYLTMLLARQADDPAFADVLTTPVPESAILAAQHQRILAATMLLIDRAKTAGVVRTDLDHTDIFLATMANAGLLRAACAAGPQASQRLTAHLLNAFTTPASAPLPEAPAQWRW